MSEMTIRPHRRSALALLAGAAAAPMTPALGAGAAHDRLPELETRIGGRIGAAILDPMSGRHLAHRGDERFPLCSTFKLLAAALVLHRVDSGEDRLERRVVFGRQDLITYSPITERRTGGDGMSLAEICHAAVTTSDNTAGNLMLASFGGPAGLTAFVRTLGDPETRLDRIEPELNDVPPGDVRDTTTPVAMLTCLRQLLAGTALTEGSRGILRGWLVASTTGNARIRAGAPAGWIVGDKTGTGLRGAASDVGILWPGSGRPPLLIAVYLDGSAAPIGGLNATIAAAARIMIDQVRQPS